MELYNELRENWERLYWDEGYSNKIARDHANYESAEEDDEDFNPYRFFLLTVAYSPVSWCVCKIDGFGSLFTTGTGGHIMIQQR